MAQASGAHAARYITATVGGAEEGGPAGAARMRLAAARALGRLAARMPQGAPMAYRRRRILVSHSALAGT